ncbi:MAG: PilZ domain-containing protein [Bdellovibrionales bacterium]|nr:PilZ domain-containing protein [Bdellovibrionales bacterium]
MSQKENLWCLYCISRTKLIQGLRKDEIRAVASSLPKSDLTDWMVWQEGWDLWKKLIEIDELLRPISRAVQGPLPDIEAQGPQTLTDSRVISSDNAVVERNFKDITMEDLNTIAEIPLEVLGSQSKSARKSFIKRNFKRYKKNMKIQITGGAGQVFTTTSIDISVGGIQLADPLPPWVVGYSQVKIVDPAKRQAIEVTCSVVEDQEPHYRTRLEILPLQKKEEEVKFDRWLAAA